MKNKILKICTLLVVLIMCASLFACGESAYDLAVKNGFKGSEQEWLQSLKGEPGKDGVNNISMEDLYNEAVKNGFKGDFLEFLQQYIDSSAQSNNPEYATSQALLSAVNVRSVFESKQQGRKYASLGAGVIYQLDEVTGEGFVITNYHVVYDRNSAKADGIASEITLTTYGGAPGEKGIIPATYIGGSMTYDIAVLKVEQNEVLTRGSKAIIVGDSNHVKVGSTAIAVGNPDGGGIAVTNGVISVDSEYIEMYGADEQTPIKFRTMRVDTAINHGNSGGGLFNGKGELIGIVNAKIEKAGVDNIGYVIPANIAINVADNIIWNNKQNGGHNVYKGLIGITVGSEDSYAYYNEELQMTEVVETVIVADITRNSPAYGEVKQNDIIVSISKNGKTEKITRMFMVVDYMLTARPGDVINLEVIRNGKNEILSFTMKEENFVNIR